MWSGHSRQVDGQNFNSTCVLVEAQLVGYFIPSVSPSLICHSSLKSQTTVERWRGYLIRHIGGHCLGSRLGTMLPLDKAIFSL